MIYQIYLRSFFDTGGNGVGDLAGIARKLDYVADLGVDAIWVTPFFTSPMVDFGYDVSDYRAVDPLFGELHDFDHLLEEAHRRGLRVIIDQVLSHTSDQHRWFQQSRKSRDNRYADWYVWADAKADGTPPNNWLAVFGGGAWTWDPSRCQYYLHNFLSAQPDLNYHNPAVQAQMLEEVEFWLRRGVDGLRLDAINFCFQDADLRDNPPKPLAERQGRGFSTDNPYAWQRHYYNNTRPEMLPFLERLRGLIDRYPGVMTLGEVSSEDSLGTMAEYTAPGRLHMAYSFELLADEYSGRRIRHVVSDLEQRIGDGWACWTIGNHDVRRVLSRWGGDSPDPRQAIMLNNLLLALKGTICSYQGEELGLTEAAIEYSQVQDPYGLAFWPRFKGRDGCRTPFPWAADGDTAGFSTAAPWLPIPAEHRERSVAIQEQRRDSTLQAYRRMVALRRSLPALATGDIRFVDTPPGLLAFERSAPGEQLLCAFNLCAESGGFSYPARLDDITPGVLTPSPAGLRAGDISLAGFGTLVARIT